MRNPEALVLVAGVTTAALIAMGLAGNSVVWTMAMLAGVVWVAALGWAWQTHMQERRAALRPATVRERQIPARRVRR